MADRPAHGASLTEIAVTGFRGIGPRRVLTLQPGPGLTLVVGRNGSGKSSFAEGLEILLTGSNWRWAHRSNVWREGWRNLHAPAATSVAATFAVEGEAGAVTLTRKWPDGAALEGSTLSVQTPSKRTTTLDGLGWTGALEPYRPFLSYNELGSMFEEGPTRLHDRLLAILGLGEYDAQAADLRARRLELDKAVRDVKGRLPGLLARLESLRDPRAQAAAAALRKRVWDLESAEQAAGTVSGTGEETAQLEILRDLERLPAPGIEETLQLAQILRELISRTRALEKTPAGRAGDLAGILRAALAFHGKHGEAACPVCATDGVLDQAWRDGAEIQVRELDQLSTEWQALMRLQRDANAHAHRLQSAAPPVLTRAAEVGLARDAGILITAWNTFAERPEGGARELADHLEATIDPVVAAAETLREAARAELDRREGVWRPIAQELTRWLLEARPALEGQARSEAFKREEVRLKDEQARLKSERFEPIADRAIAFWNVLRHQSNVELERIVLEGEGTKRRVDMSVTVDGVEGAALGVMSQGELHAIALSLFLPRASLDDSPFRFVVIDDPVQSMDPARVDGLARVLEDVARTRQAIVFTHDDRLAEAVRRLGIDAHVLEVTRREGSVVEVREGRDPVSRNLADAGDVAASTRLPALVAQQVVPGFLRAAIEAACVEVVRRRRLGRGDAHADVEALLEANPKTTSRMSLALFDTAAKGADVAPKVRGWGHDLADALQVATKGAHAGYRGDLEALVRDIRALCTRIQQLD